MAKRARERARQERQDAKRVRRESGPDDASEPVEAADESALMEEFHELSERHAAGMVGQDAYDQERRRIFVELGIESEEDG